MPLRNIICTLALAATNTAFATLDAGNVARVLELVRALTAAR